MKNKLAKSMSMIIAIAMLISMVPAVVSADTPTLDGWTVEFNDAGTGIIVTPDATSTLEEYTLLAVRADNALTLKGDTNSLASLSEDDDVLANHIEYIDQPKVSEGAVTFLFRDRTSNTVSDGVKDVTGRTVTVFLGAEGADAIAKDLTPALKAPTVTLAEGDYIAGVTESFVTIADAEGWLTEGASLAIYTMIDSVKTEVGSVEANGAISFDDNYPTDVKAAYTIEGIIPDGEEDAFEAFTAKSFNAISKYGAAKAKLPAIQPTTNETNTVITLPDTIATDNAEYYGYEITFSYTATDKNGDPVGEGMITESGDNNEILTVTRPADAGDEIWVTVTATFDGSKTYTYNKIVVYDVTKTGPSFTADDITIIENELLGGAYGKVNMAVIIVDNTNAAFETDAERLVIKKADETEYNLYYVEARNWFVGLVPVYDAADMDAKKALAQPEIKNVAYPEGKDADDYMVYYGNVAGAPVDPASGMPFYDTNDTNAIKKILKGTTFDDSVYLAADFANGKMDANINTNETNELKKYFKNVFIEVDGELVPNDLAINKVSVGE